MFKKSFLIACTMAVVTTIFAQVTDAEKSLQKTANEAPDGWKNGGSIGVNLSQASFSNWAAGGQNSVAINGLVSLFASYKKNGHSWDNTLDLGYGMMKQGSANFIKTDDKIDFSSKYGKSATKEWYYAALFNFKTQMTAGYNYPNDSVKISQFLAPAYLIGALGFDYKPNAIFSAFLAPLTYRGTIVGDKTLANAGAFGVTKATYDANGTLTQAGEQMRHEFGGYVRLFYKNSFFENGAVTFQSKLDLFSNYLKNPENIVINWENIFTFKVTKYIAASFVFHLVYDDNIKTTKTDGTIGGPNAQIKQVLAIGFSHKF